MAPDGTSTFGYLGWTGHRNMGDDAIELAVRSALRGIELLPVPVGPRALVRGRWPARQLRRSPLLLGGGTVLGRRIWRAHLGIGLVLTAPGPAFMLGAGVEDPEFHRPGHLSERHELRHWTRPLRRFAAVTVRGPRSAELLTDAGIPARVIGDPAFLLEPPAPPVRDEGLVGINLGTSDDLWGHDQPAVVRHVAGSVRTLSRRGRRFRFLIANPADRPHAEHCAQMAGLPSGQWELVDAVDPFCYLGAAGDCEVIVAERLHAGILAACAGTGVVMLEYQPKCRDFLRSVGLDDYGIRTDRLRSGHVVDLVEHVTATGAALRPRIGRAVDKLRAELRREAASIRATAASSNSDLAALAPHVSAHEDPQPPPLPGGESTA